MLSPVCVSDTVEVVDRAVIGLGIETPLETGLTLHHTYGTPVIPGSSLKGLAAHYCAEVWSAGNQQSPWRKSGEYYRVIFGDTEDAGHIIFHDSWVLPESLPNCLQMDVMTVHHPEYYQDGQPPTDYEDPVPVTFLSFRGRFRLFVQSDVCSDEGKKWAQLAAQLLREAMENWGIGGKTAAGYGRVFSRAHQEARPASRVETVAPKVSLKQGETIQAVLIDEKTKAGGWKAAYGSERAKVIGHILNTGDVPAGCKVGDTVNLVVHSVSRNSIVFRWPRNK